MKKYDVVIVYHMNKREIRKCSYFKYLLLKLFYSFSKVKVFKV